MNRATARARRSDELFQAELSRRELCDRVARLEEERDDLSGTARLEEGRVTVAKCSACGYSQPYGAGLKSVHFCAHCGRRFER